MRFPKILPILVIAVAGCQSTPPEPAVTSISEPPSDTPSHSVQLTVTLTEATQRPTPVGLPTRLAITAPRVPAPGTEVEVTWQALDGDPDREPRQGSGRLELSAELPQATISLRGPGQPAEAVLTLVGTITASEIRGGFSDRLFYPRAGLFVAEIREP